MSEFKDSCRFGLKLGTSTARSGFWESSETFVQASVKGLEQCGL